MIFWVVAGLMTLAALGLVVWPLLRTRSTAGDDRRAQNLRIYRDRLEELETDAKAGIISSEELSSAREELLRRLPSDVDENDVSPPPRPRKRWRWTAALVAVVIPLIGLGLYVADGGLQRVHTAQEMPKLARLNARLVQHLQAHPQDPAGWVMLGRLSMTLGHYGRAAKAFEKAGSYIPKPEPSLLTSQGEALGMAAGGDFRGKPRHLFKQALKLNPDAVEALWYAGIAAMQAGDSAAAVNHWAKIPPEDLPEKFRPVLRQRLAQARQMTRETNGFKLPVQVTLSPKLKSQVKPDEKVFIYALAQSGAKMPLAVAKRAIRDLPLKLNLTDAMGMVDGPALSSLHGWVVVARVSRSGDPMPNPGDLYAKRKVERDKLNGPVQLEISQRVP